MSSERQTWTRHSARAIRSSLGYVIERDHRPGQPVDTVFICWAPNGQVIGGASGAGIDREQAVSLCERHAAGAMDA